MAVENHLDRIERFVRWLEARRREAGLTQKQLCELAGISISYYCKTVTIRRFREKYGRDSNRVCAPKSFDFFKPILTALKPHLGEGIAAEAEAVWEGRALGVGSTSERCLPTGGEKLVPEGTQSPVVRYQETESLVRLLVRIHHLPAEKRQLVENLVDHLS